MTLSKNLLACDFFVYKQWLFLTITFAKIGGANDKSKPEKVQIEKTGGQNSKYFHGASLVCISDHFEQKFTCLRLFCAWVKTISNYHFCQNRRCKWQIQTWKSPNIKNRRSELKILSRSILGMYKRSLWAKIYRCAIFLYISNDYF